MLRWRIIFLIAITGFLYFTASAQQQDVDLHIAAHLFAGQKIIKVKRDFNDPYLWALSSNNEVYRINSDDFTIVDYTPKFEAYRHLGFVDVAGRSKDTVLVATNSPNLLELKFNNLQVIGSADGITTDLNSVGIEQRNYYYNSNNYSAIVGSNKGIYFYDLKTDKIRSKADNTYSEVFEASYRNEIWRDSSINNYPGYNGIEYMPIKFVGDYTLFGGFLWESNDVYGYHIKTAIDINRGIVTYNGDAAYARSQVWGNSKGLFINTFNSSYLLGSAHQHYLDGIEVTKASYIYGLEAFGDLGVDAPPGLIKQTMLIGTGQGLYFSDNIYQKPIAYQPGITFFHYPDLGNVRVNDISINAKIPIQNLYLDGHRNCEDGAWVACDDGLYFIKTDYGRYISPHQNKVISFKDQQSDPQQLSICQGTSLTAQINDAYVGQNSIQWYKDGASMPGKTGTTLNITTAGQYYAAVYDPCSGLHIESNHLEVSIISSPAFTFAYPDKLQLCDQTSTTLQVDQSPDYQYRWYKDGVLNGNTTYQQTVTESGKYKVEVSACTNSWVPSKEIEVDLINLPTPQVQADKDTWCTGETALLTSSVPLDPAYTINWYRNGVLIPSAVNLAQLGTTEPGLYTMSITSTLKTDCIHFSAQQQISFISAPTFAFPYGDVINTCGNQPVSLTINAGGTYQYRWYKDGMLLGNEQSNTLNIMQNGAYRAEVSACDGAWTQTKSVTVNMINLPQPVIHTDKVAYCMGDVATLSIDAPTDPSYTINWLYNGSPVAQYQDQTSINTANSGNYMVQISSRIISCMQSSTQQVITFNDPPTVSISQQINTTLCQGQTVTLVAQHSPGASVLWSTGATTDKIDVTNSGTYSVQVKTAAGCTASDQLDFNFLPNPVLNIADASVCTFTGQTVTLNAPDGYTRYSWNNIPGTSTYTVDKPQQVTLTVVDNNGCQTTTQINITNQCPDVHIPNTFTPNGDGINDRWNLFGLESDPSVNIRVFNRYGQSVYQARTTTVSWDGTSNGQRLPAGAYYYIITAKNGQQTFTGSVTIVY